MVVGDKCPKCGAFTLVNEPDYNRQACLKLECGYIEYHGAKVNKTEVERDVEEMQP